MNTNTHIDKIDKVLSKISGKEMKGFVRQYAATHDLLALFLCHGFHPLFPSARRTKEAAVALLDGHPQHLREFFGLTHLEFTLIFQLAAEGVVGDAQNMGHMAQFHALAADAVADHHGIGHRRFSFQFCAQRVPYNHWLYYIFRLIICQHYSQNSP